MQGIHSDEHSEEGAAAVANAGMSEHVRSTIVDATRQLFPALE